VALRARLTPYYDPLRGGETQGGEPSLEGGEERAREALKLTQLRLLSLGS
jgi:hypothetical protein